MRKQYPINNIQNFAIDIALSRENLSFIKLSLFCTRDTMLFILPQWGIFILNRRYLLQTNTPIHILFITVEEFPNGFSCKQHFYLIYCFVYEKPSWSNIEWKKDNNRKI